VIVTERLILRPAEPRDRAALHAMWADPRVMKDLGPVKDEAASDAAIARHAGYRADGLGFCVVERRDDGAMLGFCGLKPGAPTTPIRGELEIGWMLAHAAWGQGYAREAAAAWLAWAWAHRAEPRVVAITAANNVASQRLMERLGMRQLGGGDFDHPDFTADDPRRMTVTYAIDRPR
jgi:RimJ/RimL family protein N-acetyltransferase